MALSNWDTLAFGPDGQSTIGEYVSPKSKIGVSIYKNWLYVEDPRGWKKSSAFTKPVVMQIEHGSLSYCDLSIQAARHDKQNAVFCLVSRYDNKTGKCDYFGGIGCYGYIDDVEWYMRNNPDHLRDVLIEQGGEWAWKMLQKGKLDYMSYSSSRWDDDNYVWINGIYVSDRTQGGRKSDKSMASFTISEGRDDIDTFVGVEDSTYRAWLEWVAKQSSGLDSDLHEWLEKVKAGTPLRYNQGDAFFAAAGVSDLPATPIGEQEPTVLSQMLTPAP